MTKTKTTLTAADLPTTLDPMLRAWALGATIEQDGEYLVLGGLAAVKNMTAETWAEGLDRKLAAKLNPSPRPKSKYDRLGLGPVSQTAEDLGRSYG